MSEEAQETTVEIVYLGRRPGTAGKVVYAAQVDGKERYYTKRPFGLPSYASPGQVWAITFTGDEFYVRGEKAPRFVRLFPDAEYRALWAAKDRAAQATVDNAKDAKSGDDSIAELARPLRLVYARATAFERAALLIRIIAEVQGGIR